MAALALLQKVIGPCHLLIYGLLLGTEAYQSLLVTKITYQSLPPAHFITLQNRLFPAYFRAQSLLAALLVATYPPLLLTFALGSWSEAVPLGVSLLTSALNWAFYGPRCRAAMMARAQVQQETRNAARKHIDTNTDTPLLEGGQSSEEETRVAVVKRRFSVAHAMAIHLNFIGLAAVVWYGVGLGGRLDLS